MRGFVAEHGLEDVVQIADLDDEIWPRFGVRYQPAWVLIDEDGSGKVIAGALAGEALDRALEELTNP